MIGRLGAEVLRAAVRDGAVVGIGDGVVDLGASPTRCDEPLRETGATVVPLCGGYWFTGPAREPFRRVADAIGGVPQGLLAPGLVDDPATKRSLVAHAGVRRILELWDRLDVAVFGIGGPAWSEAAFGEATLPAARRGRGGRRDADRARSTSTGGSCAATSRDADDRVRRRAARRVPVRIGVAGGPAQGPADPRRAARRVP